MGVTKYKSIKLKSRGDLVTNRTAAVAGSGIDITFSGSSNNITVISTNNTLARIKALFNSGFRYDGYAGTSASSYPKALFRGYGNKTLTAYGLGYGSGIVFWGTDSANWWAAVNDIDTSQSYDTLYACNAYSCATYGCTTYTYNTRYGVYTCTAYGCSSYVCSSYYSYFVNYRYNPIIKIIRSISNSISTVASVIYTNSVNNGQNPGQVTFPQIAVSFDGAGNVTATAYDSGGSQRTTTSASGGSGNTIGFIGGPITNTGSFTANPYINRFKVNP